jgi:hypothetical protein
MESGIMDSMYAVYGQTQLIILGTGAVIVLFMFGLSKLGGFLKGAILGVIIGVIARFGVGYFVAPEMAEWIGVGVNLLILWYHTSSI